VTGIYQRLRRAWASARKGRAKGFTLVEVLIVALALGIMAAIALPAYSNAMSTIKINSFATTLADLQAASDAFQAQTAAFPTYSGTTVANQPVKGTSASEISYTADDNLGNPFYPDYLRVQPDTVPADFDLQASNGAQVYYGVTANGVVFATQVQPTSGQWTSGTDAVYTQSSARILTNGAPTSVQLSTIW